MTYDNKDEVLDVKKLNRMKFHIFKEEKENQKTRVLTEGQMVDKVRKIIEEEVKKCY